MSEEAPVQVTETGELDNPLRAIIVVNHNNDKDNDMEEALLDCVQSFDEVNRFFDKFDEAIAIPNEEHIKYEVGSDGLVIIIVDTVDLRRQTLEFITKYADDHKEDISDDEENAREKSSKKSRTQQE